MDTKKKWTEKEIKILLYMYPSKDTNKIAEFLNRSKSSVHHKANCLGLKKTPEYIEEFYKRCAENIKKNDSTRFKKGHKTWNKGITNYMGANVTSFKKGGKPHNTRNEGETRLNKEGYILVKVSHRKWIRKHRLIWEQAHGEIPKGYVIRIKDGNKENFSLENMELITMAYNMRLNAIHRFPAELKQTIRLLKKLKKKINEKQNSRP